MNFEKNKHDLGSIRKRKYWKCAERMIKKVKNQIINRSLQRLYAKLAAKCKKISENLVFRTKFELMKKQWFLHWRFAKKYFVYFIQYRSMFDETMRFWFNLIFRFVSTRRWWWPLVRLRSYLSGTFLSSRYFTCN